MRRTIEDAVGEFMALFGQYLPDDPNYYPALPWLDKKVREAMSLAIDREAIAEVIFSGYASPAAVPQYMPWNDEFEVVPYDPDRAKELLKEAGYEDGFPVKAWPVAYSFQPPEIFDLMEAISGYWEAIGLHCEIKILQPNTAGMRWYARQTAGVACSMPALIQFPPYDNIFSE